MDAGHSDSGLGFCEEFEFLYGSDEDRALENSLLKWCLQNGERGQQIKNEWDYEKNKDALGNPYEMGIIAAKSGKAFWWKCSNPGCNNEFKMVVASRTSGRQGCPICGHKRGGRLNRQNAADRHSLLDWCKENGYYGSVLIAEWDKEENLEKLGIDMENVSDRSSIKVHWKCSRCNEKFTAGIMHRVCLRNSCPRCNRSGTSYPEQVICNALRQLWSGTLSRTKLFGFEYDIYIPEKKFCMEYNGSYWHRGKKERDEMKETVCLNNGFAFMRIDSGLSDEEEFGERCIKVKANCRKVDKQLRDIIKYVVELLGGEYEKVDYEKAVDSASRIVYGPVKDNLVEIGSPLVKEWDPELNNGIRPEYFTAGSNKEINWKCSKCGRHWKVSIKSRTRFETGCVYCGYCVFDGKIRKPNGHRKKAAYIFNFI